MKIPYEVMLGHVLTYCNQEYTTPEEIPAGLICITKQMCEYAETHDSNILSESIAGGNLEWGYAGKDIFQVFSGLLTKYKRLKTL